MENEIKINLTSEKDTLEYLQCMDNYLISSLHTITYLDLYAQKIHQHATRNECCHNNNLAALIAAYINPINSVTFITTVSVKPFAIGNGIAEIPWEN